MKLVLLGAPGAGKGTQSEILSKHYNIPAISTGQIFREAMKNETPLGHRAKEYVDRGKLVPDDVVIGVVLERLARDDCKNGFILDGVPRTIPQAEALEKTDFDLDTVIAIEIADEAIVERMAGRRVCRSCGATYHVQAKPPKTPGVCDKCAGELYIRDDDAPETTKHRLEVYHSETEPLKEFYAARGKLRIIDSRPTAELTTQAIMKALEA